MNSSEIEPQNSLSFFEPRGVVLDEPQAIALLYAAATEGLVDPDSNDTDGFVKYHILKSPPSESLLRKSMEQLVMGGKIYIPFYIPSKWGGKLFDLGIVERIEPLGDDQLVEVSALPYELILGMLRERGYHWSENEFNEKLDRAKEANEYLITHYQDKGHPAIDRLIAFANTGNKDGREKYTEAEEQEWYRLTSEVKLFEPALICANHYRRVISCGLKHSALSSLPIKPANLTSFQLEKTDDNEKSYKMIEIVNKQFAPVPIGSNLSETIDMALSPEGLSFRIKIAEWTNLTRQGNPDAQQIISEDIADARKALMYSKALVGVGTVSTIISVAAIKVEALIPELQGILGNTATVVGGLSAIGKDYIDSMNRWAMYCKK